MTFLELFEQMKAQKKAETETKKVEKKPFNIEEAKALLEKFKNWSGENGKQDQNN